MNRLRPQNGTASAGKPSSLAAEVIAARVFVDVVVPRTTVAGKMRLLSRAEMAAARAAARLALAEVGLTGNVEIHQEWHDEFGTRVIAEAIRDPADKEQPLAPLADWQQCDDDQIAPLFKRYQDLDRELDPLADPTLTEARYAEIEDAAKKKDSVLLMSYGSCALSAFAITSVGRHAT